MNHGVYRVDLRYGDLLKLGVSPADAQDIAGAHTVTLKNGRWHRETARPGHSLYCSGRYVVSAGRLSFVVDPLPECDGPGGDLDTATWAVREEEVTLTESLNVRAETFDLARYWHRIARPPSGTELRR